MANQGTILKYVYELERKRGGDLWFTQPMGGGRVKTYTFGEAIEEARRVAAFLDEMNLEKGSKIILCSKNTAWWIIADLAIWMAGHVTVPIYPTLTDATVRYIVDHSEAKLAFIGKLDDWAMMADGFPPELRKVEMPSARASAPISGRTSSSASRRSPARPTATPRSSAPSSTPRAPPGSPRA